MTDAVHAKGSFIFVQLWNLGRAANPAVLEAEGLPYVSASDVPLTGIGKTPRPLSTSEIKRHVEAYSKAVDLAVNKAGFDGVEIHNAHGYLLDQFLQTVSNHRTDEYGGSVENRARFSLDVIDAIVKAIGASKTAIRLSPWSKFQGRRCTIVQSRCAKTHGRIDMAMADPKPTFSYAVSQIKERFPTLAYLHVVEPRVDGNVTRENGVPPGQSNDFLRDIWAPLPYMSAGAHTRDTGIEFAETKGDLVAYGRPFIANVSFPLT